MMQAEQIDEIRRIVRLEALRAAVFSVASESLDAHHCQMVVDVTLEGETLAATIQYVDAAGNVITGGSL